MIFKDKNITVVGLGKSGFSSAVLLNSLGAKVKVTEVNRTEEIIKRLSKLKTIGVMVEVGRHSVDTLKNQDLIIVSPGVAWESFPLVYAKKHNIPIIGEVELGYLCCNSPIIAITGTNGKTTVSTMLHEALTKAGTKSILCGNIGIPFTQVVKETTKDSIVVLEVSSFQLKRIIDFRPFIGILLNVDQDHLDRHKSMLSYKQAKYNMFSNQTEDNWSIIIDPDCKLINKKSKSVFLNNGNIISKSKLSFKDIDFDNPKIDINKKVVLIALSILDRHIEKYKDTVLNFKNLEHRLEFVTKINGVSFINDSKSTNISSTVWALDKYDNVLLIAGGRNKDLDFNLMPKDITKKIKHVLVIGEASKAIKKVFSKFCPVYEAKNLKDAVKTSYKLASSGDNVLLSPMCASFDMFRDYKERGCKFKEEILTLSKGKPTHIK